MKPTMESTSEQPSPSSFLSLMLGGTNRDFLGWLIFATILSVFAAGAFVWASKDVTNYKHPTFEISYSSALTFRGLHRWKLERVRQALRRFRRERGQYPETLKQLSSAGWLESREMLAIPGCQLKYRLSSSREFELLCVAP